MEASAYERLLAADQSRGRAYVDEGWLPPEDDRPELAPLRAEHLRLLGIVNETFARFAALAREAESVERRRDEAVREAILAGNDAAKVEIAPPDPRLVERARRDQESAAQALTIFVQRALDEIEASAPTIEANVADRLRQADAKRQEARRLLAEAERLAAEPKRLLSWLDRYVSVTDEFSGEQRKRSMLGPIPYSSTDLPLPVASPGLITEMVLGLGEAMEVGTDELLEEEKEAILNAR